MSFRRITEEDMRGRGNIGQPDAPGVSTAEMQRILDELPREVIAPAFNQLADQLEADTAADSLGARLPGDPGELPEDTPHTVQGVQAALLSAMQSHQKQAENPHGVTAQQVGAYTKKETEDAISQRVKQIGSADMNQADYGGSAPGVVRRADQASNADRLGGSPASYYASAAGVRLFSATIEPENWAKVAGPGTDHPDAKPQWTQTVPCAGMQADFSCSPPWVFKIGNPFYDEGQQLALNIINDGYLETLDGQIRVNVYQEPKKNTVTLWMRRADENAVGPGGSGGGSSGGGGSGGGGEGGGGGSSYVLPIAGPGLLGGIQAVAKTPAHTEPVAVDPITGQAYVKPVGGGSGGVNVPMEDQRISGESLWSSRSTVDHLCPLVSQEGSQVKLNLVEHYPLEVVSRIDPDRHDGSGFDVITLDQYGQNLLDLTAVSASQCQVDQQSGAVRLNLTGASNGAKLRLKGMPLEPGQTYVITGQRSNINSRVTPLKLMLDGTAQDGQRLRQSSQELDFSGREVSAILTVSAEFAQIDSAELRLDEGYSRYDTSTTYRQLQIAFGGQVLPYRKPEHRTFTCQLPEKIISGALNWGTGQTEGMMDFVMEPARQIVSFAGQNLFITSTGRTLVTGRGQQQAARQAASLAAQVPETLPADTAPNVQAVLNALARQSGGAVQGRFAGRSASFLGDSQTDSAGNYKSVFFFDWIKQALGLSKVNNYGFSGSSIMPVPGQSNSFLERYSGMSGDTALIVVWGGVNDFQYGHPLGGIGDESSTTFCGALNQLCKGLLLQYPQSQVVLVTPTWTGMEPPAGVTLEQYADAMVTIGGRYGIPVYDALRNCPIPLRTDAARTYSVDGLHLNDLGHEILGKSLANWLLYSAVAGAQPTWLPDAGVRVTLSSKSLALAVGASQSLSATLSPADAPVSLTWETSDSQVATVENGRVTGRADGKATIRVRAGSFAVDSCTVTVGTGNKAVPVTGISLSQTQLSLSKGEAMRLVASVEPANATNRGISWKASNGNCTVSSGLVTARQAGSCVITVTTEDGHHTASCTVTVAEVAVPVSQVTLNRTSASMTVGDTMTLTATVLPPEASDRTVTWGASNGSCTVSNGLVTAQKPGSCTILATAGSKSASCAVQVQAVPAKPSPADGKTVTFGALGPSLTWNSLCLLVRAEDIGNTPGEELEVEMHFQDASQPLQNQDRGMMWFADKSGEVSNGSFENVEINTNYPSAKITGDTLICKEKRGPASNPHPYVKINVPIAAASRPVSFKVNSLTVKRKGTSVEILKVGAFYANEQFSMS